MLILEFNGGLGNQMFQYALYRNLKGRGKEIFCQITNDENSHLPFRLDIFPNVSYEIVKSYLYEQMRKKHDDRIILEKILGKTFPTLRIVYNENEKKSIDETVFRLDNKIIAGYFQGLDYIKPVEKLLRQDFLFPYGEERLQNQIKMLDKEAVSIHVRRGDYLQFSKIYGGICTLDYYRNAVHYFEVMGINKFVVFSNDIPWVRDNLNLNKDTVYIQSSMFKHYQDWYDMCIMSKCHHNIIANSSFSWWGAWLNCHDDKIVVSPCKFDNIHKNKNIIPNEWVKIDG